MKNKMSWRGNTVFLMQELSTSVCEKTLNPSCFSGAASISSGYSSVSRTVTS